MLPVTSAVQSDMLHLYLRAVDVYINVSHLPICDQALSKQIVMINR